MSDTGLQVLKSRLYFEDAPASGGRRIKDSSLAGQPLISVITISRNDSAALRATIKSVLSQNVSGLEYVVVDGGSSDDTVEMLRGLGDSLDYWISQPDAGIADAFNKGLSLVRGEVVGILNAGDVYEPGALAAIAALVREDKTSDVFYGKVKYLRPDGGSFVFTPEHASLASRMSLSHPGCFARLSSYRRLGVFDTSYRIAMDYELLLRFFLGGAVFRPVELPLACMDMRGVSNTRWLAAIAESSRAKRIHQGVLKAGIYYIYASLRKLARDLFRGAGLDPLLERYRSWRKGVKKVKRD